MRLQPLAQEAAALDHLRQEAVGQHDVEHRVGDRAGQRVAAEGRAVGAGGHAGRGARGGEAGADREAAAQPLGDGGDVGRDARLLAGEQRAGAAHAGLDLVEDQQQAVLVAQRRAGPAGTAAGSGRMPPSPWIGSTMIAAVSGPIAACSASSIAERHDVEAGQQRIEALDQLLAAGGRDAGHGPAVEGALEGDDAVPLGLARAPRSSAGPS